MNQQTLTTIKDLAKAATPEEPWSFNLGEEYVSVSYQPPFDDSMSILYSEWDNETEKEIVVSKARFIAAANPQTITKLIEAYEEAVKVIEFYSVADNYCHYENFKERRNVIVCADGIDGRAREFLAKYGGGE